MTIKGGSKGKSFNDRELAGEVRSLALKNLKDILSDKYKDKKFQREIMLRLAPNLLPRLNEHTGEDGKPINIVIAPEIAAQNGIKAE